MFSYLVRRVLYSVPILIGVILLTFLLFFVKQTPVTVARTQLGKRATPENIQNWLAKRQYDKPLFFNTGPGRPFYDTVLWVHFKKLATFDLGYSDRSDAPLNPLFRHCAVPSLLITLPAFIAGFFMAVGLSLFLTLVRDSKLDFAGGIVCIALMSLPPMIFIIVGQAVIALGFNYFPAFGYELSWLTTAKFIMLPVAIMAVIHLGSDVLLYRAVFLEEIAQDYVRTAYAKGLSGARVLLVHVLKNGMITLITQTVAYLPLLVMGALLIENFFGIPGLGNLTADALRNQDFSEIMAATYVTAILYLIGLTLTDICYALVDPRIRLK